MKKVLRAIGGFFAKIGRWIANTAWIQPLLIVGGIFAVIFSIPYIKSAIDEAVAANQVDENLQYYKNRAISLDGAEKQESRLDKLFTYLETEDYAKVKSEFGEKFFLTFVSESCSACKEGAPGFSKLDNEFRTWGLQGNYKLHSVMVDTTNDDGDYLAKEVLKNHSVLFEALAGDFGEDFIDNYALYKNFSSSASSLASSITALATAVNDNGEGFETPTTFFIDVTEEGLQREVSSHGVTAIFFNYATYVSDSTAFNKGKFLQHCWNYDDVFDPYLNEDKAA